MTASKPDWRPDQSFPVGKGASVQHFVAAVGNYKLEIDVARWGEGHLRANGLEIAHTATAKDARQAFRDLRKIAEQYLKTQAAGSAARVPHSR
jgi:enoyl-[acyl-carrier protein] reductase I